MKRLVSILLLGAFLTLAFSSLAFAAGAQNRRGSQDRIHNGSGQNYTGGGIQSRDRLRDGSCQ